jgi:hypothetical protein
LSLSDMMYRYVWALIRKELSLGHISCFKFEVFHSSYSSPLRVDVILLH